MRLTAPRVVSGWALMNTVLVIVLVIYGGGTFASRLVLYALSVVIVAMVAVAMVISLRRQGRRPSKPVTVRSGAPALALASACLAGALAWVFGLWMSYLALPLVGFCIARFRADRRKAT
jgi:hypothetical protein